jgi:glyoxylase-like metal-dependent hydrolase (beta-lactamase superfamily II)
MTVSCKTATEYQVGLTSKPGESDIKWRVKGMAEGTLLIDLGFVNTFLARAGDGYILIDTGVKQQWARLERELLQAGCLPDKLKLVIVTHGDSDHFGNCRELQRKYGVKIAMHAGDVAMVTTGVRVKRHARNLLGKLFLWMTEKMGGSHKGFQPDVLVDEGESLAAYGWAATVLHTPGHTRGSIAILTDDGQLFAGDTVTNRTKPARAAFVENEQELQESLARLKQVKAQVVYPGHGKPFSIEMLSSIH